MTYYHPTAADRTIKEDASAAGETFRVLLRFDDLHKFVPSGVKAVALSLRD
jgi:hypothetical protein